MLQLIIIEYSPVSKKDKMRLMLVINFMMTILIFYLAILNNTFK